MKPCLFNLGLVDGLALKLHRHVDGDFGGDAIRVEEILFVDVDVDAEVVVSDAEAVGRRHSRTVKIRQFRSIFDVLGRLSTDFDEFRRVSATFGDVFDLVLEDLELVDVRLVDVISLRLSRAAPAVLAQPVKKKMKI